jgi:transcriptional regulator with XRE-family HTH domain
MVSHMPKTTQRKSNGNKVLLTLREALGINQGEIAQRVGLSEVYICNLERGTYTIGTEAALKIINRYRSELHQLGLELEDLLRSGR